MPATYALQKKVVFSLLLLFLAGSLPPAHAQDRGRLSEDAAADPFPALRRPLTGEDEPLRPLALEGALDPQAYIVGPGDVFTISVGGSRPLLYNLRVTPDGHLTLPEAGSLPVAGKTLAATRAAAVAALRPHYQNVQADVALTQPRRFYVHVSGAVPTPGRYLSTAVERASDVLALVFSDTSHAPVTNEDFQPALRNVFLTRQDGTRLTLDLHRYFTTGDTRYNPYLQDGDILTVPAYDPRFESVFVDGAIPFPGTYDHRPDDTVLDLLVLGAGTGGLQGLDRVRLTRRQPDGGLDTLLLRVADLRARPETAPRLQPLDHLYVLPERVLGGTATVQGWVYYPGTYPIEPNRTTLEDLIRMAGGLRPGALERGTYLERKVLERKTQQIPSPSERVQRRTDRALRPTLQLRPDSAAILQQLRLADLDFLSRAYFAQELRMQNRVSIDLAATLAPGSRPVYLQDGDRLVIPRDEQTIYVFGQVNRPGYVTYVPGWGARDYLAAAGGMSPLAAAAYVIEAGTGRYIPAGSAALQSGDMIFVDRQLDVAATPELQRIVLEESRAQADARIRTTQTVLSLVGTAATVIFSAINTYIILRSR